MRILAAALLLCSTARTVPAGYTETTLVTGMQRPVALAFLPDGRLLIGEQYTGKIRLFKNGALNAVDYATLAPIQTSNNETGLLGLCIDPNFATNGYVYVCATQSATVQRIWRYTTVGDGGTSPTLVVDNLPTQGINHDGGGIRFGPDGMLYVCIGENATTITDAQLTNNWKGKILRFDTSGVNATTPAVAAAGNPFGAGNAVWTYGHRNPFRFCWQPGTGEMYCTENGPNTDDEINRIVAGQNYGWPNVTGVAGNPLYKDPILSLTPTGTVAITGCLFYTGSTMPALSGRLVFVEYKTNKVRYLSVSGDTVTAGPFDFVTASNQPVDVAQGPDGAIYYCTLVGGLYKAQINAAVNQAPSASFSVTPPSGPPTLTVNVDATGSIDTDGTISSYAWNWGDGSANGAGITASHGYTATGTYTITLTVTDNLGATGVTTQDAVCISAGNSPPSAHIESATPSTGPAPLAVQFAGHAHDNAGPLEHRWDFGDGSGFLTIPGNAPDINSTPAHTYAIDGIYTVTLRVKDPEGITAIHQIQIWVGGSASGGGRKKKKCGLLGIEGLLILAAIAALRRRR